MFTSSVLRLRHPAALILGLIVVALPGVLALAGGALESPLWLDEIAYHHFSSDQELRALEIGRPASLWTRVLSNYAYGDLQDAARRVLEQAGVRFEEHPDAVLRLLPVVAYFAAVLLLFAVTLARTRSALAATLAAGMFSYAPLFLSYAFEARGYMLACLGALAFYALVEHAVAQAPADPHGEASSGTRLLRLGAIAIVSVALAHLHPWTACLFLGLLVALATDQLRRAGRLDDVALIVAAAVLPLATLALQAAYLVVTDPGRPEFPLFRPRSALVAVQETLRGTFAPPQHLSSQDLAAASPLVHLAALIQLALILVVWRTMRPSAPRVLLSATLLAIASSMIAMVTVGGVIPVRHQVFLLATLPYSLPRTGSVPTRLLAGALVALGLLLLPPTLLGLERRSNGRAVAEVLREYGSRDDVVVVQHSLRFGYPDPVLAYPADFYLNELHPREPRVTLLELPTLRDIAGERELSPRYLRGGQARLEEYASVDPRVWLPRLGTLAARRVWLLAPRSHTPVDRQILNGFEQALAATGFVTSPSCSFPLVASPSAELRRYDWAVPPVCTPEVRVRIGHAG